jgi:hypothetical protein
MKLPRDSASPVIKSSASPAAAANVPTSQTWTNRRPLAHTVRRWRAAAGPLPPQMRLTLHTTWANSRASARPCFARSRGPGLRGAGSPGGGISPAFPYSRRPPPQAPCAALGRVAVRVFEQRNRHCSIWRHPLRSAPQGHEPFCCTGSGGRGGPAGWVQWATAVQRLCSGHACSTECGFC